MCQGCLIKTWRLHIFWYLSIFNLNYLLFWNRDNSLKFLFAVILITWTESKRIWSRQSCTSTLKRILIVRRFVVIIVRWLVLLIFYLHFYWVFLCLWILLTTVLTVKSGSTSPIRLLLVWTWAFAAIVTEIWSSIHAQVHLLLNSCWKLVFKVIILERS